MDEDGSFLWDPTETELKSCFSEQEGSFYVFHEDRLRENCNRFAAAFSARYPDTRMAYSVKTNYLPPVIEVIEDMGWYSEVVSGFEYDLVRRLGVEGRNIIFNGPVKLGGELERSVREGSLINIDSIAELIRIHEICESSAWVARLGLRLNFGKSIEQSRFGLDAEDEAAEAVAIIQSSEFLELEALHAHYCFNGKKPETYGLLVRELIQFIDRQPGDLWNSIKMLNLGGGFFSPMPEKMAQNWGGEIPSYEDYAEAITEPLNEHLAKINVAPPQLTLEPGLAVVADAMSFVCAVDNVKKGSKAETAILTGSVYNIKPTKSAISLPWRHIPSGNSAVTLEGSLTGYTCMEDDVMEADFCGSIAPGDAFLFGNVGAYTNVLQPPFIRLSPAVLTVKEGVATTLVPAESSERFMQTRFNLVNKQDHQ